MSTISHDIVTKISDLQSQIWQTVSLKVSESIGQGVTFASPLTVSTRTADIYSEMGTPMMVVQFAFAGLSENAQVVLIPQDTVIALGAWMHGDEIEEVDDNLVAELRPICEAVVQGICVAVGSVRSETIVATDLSIRFQLFNFPPNIQKAIDVIRTQVAITADDEVNGTAIWLVDDDTAHAILNLTPEEEQEEEAFPALDPSLAGSVVRQPSATDTEGIGILMDIPLEISVELGRVKMLVKDIVELGTGSIVEIDKAAGEPVDVMVNGRLVAKGEVVVIEDNFGVRLTEILNPQERINRLGDAA
jgi:flagellar motor switch protein FliN/FliY